MADPDMTDETTLLPVTGRDVTVVIPTHDRPALLARCLASVTAQTDPPAAVIVVEDGGVTPATAQVVAESAAAVPTVPVVHLGSVGGAPCARNVGLARVTTSLTAFVDDDDHWHPDFVAAATRALTDAPSAAAVVAGTIRQGEHGTTLSNPPLGTSASCLVRTGGFGGSNGVIRTAALRAIGGWDEHLRSFQDRDLQLRLLRAGHEFVRLPEHLVYVDVAFSAHRISTSDARADGNVQFVRKWWRVATWTQRSWMVKTALVSQQLSSRRHRRLIGRVTQLVLTGLTRCRALWRR